MLETLIGLRHRTQKADRTRTRLFEEVSDFRRVEAPSHVKIHLEVHPWMIASRLSSLPWEGFFRSQPNGGWSAGEPPIAHP